MLKAPAALFVLILIAGVVLILSIANGYGVVMYVKSSLW